MLTQLRRQLQLIATRALVRLSDPATAHQRLQVTGLVGTLDGVDHLQPYGLSARPQSGAEALLLALGGDVGHTVAVQVADRRYHLTALEEGEVALHDDQGQRVYLTRSGMLLESLQAIQIKAPTVEIVGTTTITGDTTITGRLTHQGDMTSSGTLAAQGAISSATSIADPEITLSALRSAYNTHTHPGDSGGTTGTPSHTL